MNGESELIKTSLLVVSQIFTAAGAAMMGTDVYKGSALLLLAVAVLVLRGVLKKKGLMARLVHEVEEV